MRHPAPPTPNPSPPDWSPDAGASSPRGDHGLALDPDAPLSLLQAAERIALCSLAYSGTRFPALVLAASARAVHSHSASTGYSLCRSSGHGLSQCSSTAAGSFARSASLL
ncbi:DUF5954 family protein [Streptomyces sp. NPDC048577]|uniref:DUF5954 family protein n=1 Tax=Streptomyces sp. NPDC048577 TaxID=3157209 RepID=UPI003443C2A7